MNVGANAGTENVDVLLDQVGDTLLMVRSVLKLDPEATLADFNAMLTVAFGDDTAGLAPNLTQLRLLLAQIPAHTPPAQNNTPERERTWQQNKPRPAGSRA